jgi:hypothetical protein
LIVVAVPQCESSVCRACDKGIAQQSFHAGYTLKLLGRYAKGPGEHSLKLPH